MNEKAKSTDKVSFPATPTASAALNRRGYHPDPRTSSTNTYQTDVSHSFTDGPSIFTKSGTPSSYQEADQASTRRSELLPTVSSGIQPVTPYSAGDTGYPLAPRKDQSSAHPDEFRQTPLRSKEGDGNVQSESDSVSERQQRMERRKRSGAGEKKGGKR